MIQLQQAFKNLVILSVEGGPYAANTAASSFACACSSYAGRALYRLVSVSYQTNTY